MRQREHVLRRLQRGDALWQRQVLRRDCLLSAYEGERRIVHKWHRVHEHILCRRRLLLERVQRPMPGLQGAEHPWHLRDCLRCPTGRTPGVRSRASQLCRPMQWHVRDRLQLSRERERLHGR